LRSAGEADQALRSPCEVDCKPAEPGWIELEGMRGQRMVRGVRSVRWIIPVLVVVGTLVAGGGVGLVVAMWATPSSLLTWGLIFLVLGGIAFAAGTIAWVLDRSWRRSDDDDRRGS
jgi:hypothetical protein